MARETGAVEIFRTNGTPDIFLSEVGGGVFGELSYLFLDAVGVVLLLNNGLSRIEGSGVNRDEESVFGCVDI